MKNCNVNYELFDCVQVKFRLLLAKKRKKMNHKYDYFANEACKLLDIGLNLYWLLHTMRKNCVLYFIWSFDFR